MGLIIFWIIMGIIVAMIASSKKLDTGTWFINGAVIWPIALVHVLVKKPNAAAVEQAAVRSGDLKKCPQCAELVKPDARKCRFCGYDFPG